MSENVDTAKAAYEEFRSGNLETLKERFAEDAEWLTSDELPLGGETHGRDQIIGNFSELPNYWSEFDVEPQEFIDAGDWVVVRGTQRASGEGGRFEAPFVHLMRIRNGKVERGEFYTDSAKAKAALGDKA